MENLHRPNLPANPLPPPPTLSPVAWFECTAIDDVVHGSPWYYIACRGCRTKATKGHNGSSWCSRISVYDTNDHATFVLLGDAGFELLGKQASELVESYFEANASVGDDHVVPVPQALTDTIGQTHKFIIKVSDYNLTGKSKALTVTKVLRPQTPELEINVEENLVVPSADEVLQDQFIHIQGQLLEGRLSNNNQITEPSFLTEGDTYEFSGFSVVPNSRERKLTPLPYYIQIDQETTISNVTYIGPIFPVYSFFTQRYRSLLRLATIPSYLP
ncbi:unnamed protein product, partial [Eruca vesicaria subsp. sativa]|nr:unnamed protein product [Eruca vesicaria subsp. sativa]